MTRSLVAGGRRNSEPPREGQPLEAPGKLPELLTPEEVAGWLKVSIKAIYAKAGRGTLPGATRIGRRLYFLRAGLLRLAEQGRAPHLGGPHGGT